MLTQFPKNQPTALSHARALTLREMGEEVIDQGYSEQLKSLDNDPEYDLNPKDNFVLISAGVSVTAADVSAAFDPETEKMTDFSMQPAPGNDDFSFDRFSYTDRDDETVYRFEINGQSEWVRHNKQTDLITTEL